MSLQAVFENIYATDAWSGGSGPGSFLINNHGYIRFLKRFMRKHRICSVVDFGCGDWQFSRTIDWSGVQYDGFDVVPQLIEHHTRVYGKPNIRFRVSSDHMTELPQADLLLIKDVLQHWSDARIKEFLPRLKQFKYALITNCVNPDGPTVHRDITDGDFRYLDLNQPPYSMGLPVVYTSTNFRGRFLWFLRKPQTVKPVLLYRRDA